jgi:putative transposase
MPKPVSKEELELMKLIDRCHLKHPYYGSRHIRDWLAMRGIGSIASAYSV